MAAALELDATTLAQLAAQTANPDQAAELRAKAGLPDCKFAVCVSGYPWRDLSNTEQKTIKDLIMWEGRQTFWDDKHFIEKHTISCDLKISKVGEWALIKLMPKEEEDKGNLNLRMGCATHVLRKYWRDVIGITLENSGLDTLEMKNRPTLLI